MHETEVQSEIPARSFWTTPMKLRMETKDANSHVSPMSCQADDLTRGGKGLFIWYLPIVAIIIGASLPLVRAWLWTPAFLIMGIGCVANAARCGRIHCYFTGPLFLVAAIYVVLASLHFVPMNPNVFLAAVVLLTLLAYVAELPLGKYRKSS